MNGFDLTILQFFNRPGFHSPALDTFAAKIAANLLLKGGVVLAVIWALWFSKPARAADSAVGAGEAADGEATVDRIRRLILLGFVGTFLALALARGASKMFPASARPLNYPELFTIPASADTTTNPFFINDNSFPSDHAALFYALATTIFLVSPRTGSIMFVYVTLVVVVPRLYLLLHYPSDIIAGAILGVACVMIASVAGTATTLGRTLLRRVYRWSVSHAPTFYAALFLWSFSIAELFDSIRRLAQIGPLLKALVARH